MPTSTNIPPQTTTLVTSATINTPTPTTSISHLDVKLLSSIGGAATALQIHDNYAYAGIGAELVILEINGEADLTSVGHTKLPATALDIALSDSYAYVATDRGMWVVDIGDRTMPHVVSEYAIPAGATSLVISQERLYVGTAGAGVWALDIRNPITPTMTVVFEIEETTVSDMALAGNVLYAAVQQSLSNGEFTGVNGAYMLNVSQPDTIQTLSFYDTGNVPALNVVIESDTLYVNTGWSVMPGSVNAIKVLDVHDGEQPLEISSINVGNWPISTIALRNQYLSLSLHFDRIKLERHGQTGDNRVCQNHIPEVEPCPSQLYAYPNSYASMWSFSDPASASASGGTL
jgi:hypothetical protein